MKLAMSATRCWYIFPRILLLALLGPAMVRAGTGEERLDAFFSGLKTMQAEFEQRVIDGDGVLLQESTGSVWIQRPGRFRWDYDAPYRQEIVADGERLWTYDVDLQQVTVKPLKVVLTTTPAMLLSNTQPLEELFRITELPRDQGMPGVKLAPRAGDDSIREVRLRFAGDALDQLEVTDNFGNITRFGFRKLLRNPDLDPALFTFEPPAGADVIGEED
jgi:outer membrane lipoprotein carrier protein